VEWQQLVSLIIVAAAAVLLAAGWWRRRKFSFQKDSHCGCTAVPSTGPSGSIVFHARKGQRPEVLVKMR
jgi:hypothetical protein